MLSKSVSPLGDDTWTDSGLTDMRHQALRELAIALLVGGLALIPVAPYVFGPVTDGPVETVMTLLVVAFVTLLLSDRHPHLAARVLVVGLVVVVFILLSFQPESAVLPWFAVVVLVAGFLIGPEAGALLALFGTVLFALGSPVSGFLLPPRVRFSETLLLWAATGLSWLALRPLLVALQWSWDNYSRLRSVNQLLQERQAELGLSVKSLNETLDRLDAVNHELDRARRAANQARQLKSEFAANVSHELRTPLNLIIGFSEMMATSPQSYDGQTLPTAYREDAIAVYRNARHLSDLVDDILDLSQIEAGQMGLHRDLLSLPATVDEAIDTVRVLYTQKGLTIDTSMLGDLPPIFADRTRLRQIIINLLSNAARFVEHGGASVEATLRERDFEISVRDTGSGIVAEDLPHVFNEFWQSSGPRRLAGNGVGLAVSKRFVEMHGGSMWVSSELGIGTTFTFTIPRSDSLPEMAIPHPWETWAKLRATNNEERRSVAVVSEDEDALHLFERFLDDYAIIPLGDVTALSVLPRRADLHGVIVVAPDAATAYRRGLASQLHVPGVPVVSCGLVNTRRSLAERLGVAGHLLKPINRESLAQALKKLGLARRTILVVDDDADAARLLARMIRSVSRRYQVAIALGGAEALRYIDEERPGAVFVDLVMPDIDGYALIEAIRNKPFADEISLVVVSAQVLSHRPLVSDGLVFLGAAGISVNAVFESVRFGLNLLAKAEDEAEDVTSAEAAPPSDPLPQATVVERNDLAPQAGRAG